MANKLNWIRMVLGRLRYLYGLLTGHWAPLTNLPWRAGRVWGREELAFWISMILDSPGMWEVSEGPPSTAQLFFVSESWVDAPLPSKQKQINPTTFFSCENSKWKETCLCLTFCWQSVAHRLGLLTGSVWSSPGSGRGLGNAEFCPPGDFS
jgi:hypothetical protein